MKGDYPAKYVRIRDVAVCLCPQEQKGQRYYLTADMLWRQMSHSMSPDEFIFHFSLFWFGFRFKMHNHYTFLTLTDTICGSIIIITFQILGYIITIRLKKCEQLNVHKNKKHFNLMSRGKIWSES